MDEVVATDSEAITVTRDLPNGHLGISGLEARSHCTTTSVDSVEGVSLGIIRQTRTATDT